MRTKPDEKIIAGFFALMLSLAVLPSVALAGDFSVVRSISFSPTATISSFTSFVGAGSPSSTPDWFSLSSFIQKKSTANFMIYNSNGIYTLNFFGTVSGQLGSKQTDIATISLRNKMNENVACSSFNEQKISCIGGQMTVAIVANGKRWMGTLDSYTFEMTADIGSSDQSNLGFSGAQIIGYKNSIPVLTIDLDIKSFSFNYFRNSNPALVSFQLSGGNVETINQPSQFGLKSTNLVWDFNSFNYASNKGSGMISNTIGFKGTASLNLQGTFTSGSTTYIVRNEIYMNLNNLQFSECPIFQQDHILCYIRSGYIHTYIPLSRDTTFWKAPIKLFVLEIIGNKATLTAGQNSASDVLKVSDMDVSNLRFRN